MASKKLQGITIEIDGNTTGLNDALKDVNKNLYDVQGELKQVDRMLKFDPGNAELAAQKQDLLKDAIKQTTDKLKTLKDAKEQADKKLVNGEMGQKEYRELQREIINTENSLKNLKDSSSKFKGVISQVKEKIEDASSAMDKLKKAGEVVSGALKATAGVATAAGGALVAAEVATREYRGDLSKLEANTKAANLNFNTMKDNLADLVSLTDESDSSIEALSNLMQTGFNDAGIQKTLESLSGAIIAFPDTLKIESLADGLQETLATGSATGQFAELLERCGMNLDDFNSGLAKTTTQAEKQDYILKTLSKTGMADLNSQYKDANKNILTLKKAQFELNDSLADIGKIIEPLEAEFMSFGADILGNLTSAFQEGGIDGLIAEFSNVISQVILKINEYLPQFLNLGMQLIQGIINGITANLPSIIQCIMSVLTQLIQTILSMLPQILELGIQIIVQLITGIAEQAPALIPQIIDCIILLVETILDNLDLIIDAGIELIIALADGLIESLPNLIDKIPIIIEKLIMAITNNLPKIIEMGVTLIVKLAVGLIKAIPQLVSKIPQIISAIVSGLGNGIAQMAEVGLNLIRGLWNGIKNSFEWIKNKIKGWVGDVFNFIKKLFGIHSPSTLMRDEIGENLGKGVAIGIEDTVGLVEDAMAGLGSKVQASVNPTINPTANTNPLIIQIENFNNNRDTDVAALAEELEFYRKNSATAKGGA